MDYPPPKYEEIIHNPPPHLVVIRPEENPKENYCIHSMCCIMAMFTGCFSLPCWCCFCISEIQ